MYQKLLIFLVLTGMLAGCKVAQPRGQFGDGEIVDVVDESRTARGIITFTIIGIDEKEETAIAHAKKNALEAVLFKGVNSSGKSQSRSLQPLVSSSERESNKGFFNRFFRPEGSYLDFIVKSQVDPARRLKVKGGYSIGLTVSVNYLSLQKHLENEIGVSSFKGIQ